MLLARGQSSHLTDEVIARCKEADILTVIDFLSIDTESLSQKISVPYKDISAIQRVLVGLYSSCVKPGDVFYKDILQTLFILSTGCPSLDEYLTGGIYTGEITEVHGCAGSGKTQLCLSIASSLIGSTDSTVVYLDTNGGFTGTRFKQLLSSKSKNSQSVKENLKMLRVIMPHDVYELFDALQSIADHLKLQNDPFLAKLKLLVLDSLTPLISPCFGMAKGQALLTEVAHSLKSLCKLQSLSVLVCNNMVHSGNSVKPALGLYWSFVPSVRLLLERKNNSFQKGLRSISLLKSHRRASFGEVFVTIAESGLSPAKAV